MKTKMVICCLMMGITLLMLASCAPTTKVNAVWKNENYKGPIRKITVIGASQRQAVRNLFEDEFVRELKARGTDAFASYTVLPLDQLDDKEKAAAKIKSLGADTVLIARLVDRKTVQTSVPGQPYVVPYYYSSWSSYYGQIITPVYTYQDDYAYVETNLYDLKTENLIWTARSETWMVEADQTLIKAFIKVMIDRLSADKLIQ